MTVDVISNWLMDRFLMADILNNRRIDALSES